MIDKLLDAQKKLLYLICTSKIESMYIDYHKPFVKRIWFQYGDYRIFLHSIEPCGESSDSLFHPHPWDSAVKIIKGKYEMGIGHSETDTIPKIDSRMIIGEGTIYEMVEKDAWHYVNPIENKVFSLMITGKKNNRKMPVLPESNKNFRKLTKKECEEILIVFMEHYNWEIDTAQKNNIISQLI